MGLFFHFLKTKPLQKQKQTPRLNAHKLGLQIRNPLSYHHQMATVGMFVFA